MFRSVVPPVEYEYPWVQPFSARLSAVRKGALKVAYFYEAPDNSTFRYRAFNMIEALNSASDTISASWFCKADWPNMDQVLAVIDILVICRTRYDAMFARLIALARSRGCRVVYDTDDIVVDITMAHMILTDLDEDENNDLVWDHWFAYIGRLQNAMLACDSVIVTNPNLAKAVTRAGAKDTFVIPNFMNEDQISISNAVFDAKVENGFDRDDKISIGYFSGSPSHNRDFDIAASALADVMSRDDRIVVQLVGYMEARGPLKAFEDRVIHSKFTDFVNLQRLIGKTEVNIAPLQENAFTNCKSELKFFEAAIVGTNTIASPTYTMTSAIVDGENGYISGALEWASKLEAVVSTVGTAEYEKVALAARATAQQKYCYSAVAPLIDATLHKIAAQN
ncbi:glycosyltransferase [Sphingomonas sp. UYP23]